MMLVKAYFRTDDEDVTEIRYFEVDCGEFESADKWLGRLYTGQCLRVERVEEGKP